MLQCVVIIVLLKQCKCLRVQLKMICVPLLVSVLAPLSLFLFTSLSPDPVRQLFILSHYISAPQQDIIPLPQRSALICCFVTFCFICLNIAMCAVCLSWFKYVTFQDLRGPLEIWYQGSYYVCMSAHVYLFGHVFACVSVYSGIFNGLSFAFKGIVNPKMLIIR